jgi:hypothetical protein
MEDVDFTTDICATRIVVPLFQPRHLSLSLARRGFAAALLIAIAGLPARARAEGAVHLAPSCLLDAEDADAVRQAGDDMVAACHDGSSQACLDARTRHRETVQDYCSADPCSLGIGDIPVIRNRVAARSIEEFLTQAAETSQSGAGEIGSFRWLVSGRSAGPGHRFLALNAGGAMVLPQMVGNDAPPADLALIHRAMRMIAAHEARHRDAFLAVARQACADISARVGDTNDIFRRYFCETGPGSNAAAQRQVDLLDGVTELVIAQDGKKDLVSHGADYAAARYVTAGLCE